MSYPNAPVPSPQSPQAGLASYAPIGLIVSAALVIIATFLPAASFAGIVSISLLSADGVKGTLLILLMLAAIAGAVMVKLNTVDWAGRLAGSAAIAGGAWALLTAILNIIDLGRAELSPGIGLWLLLIFAIPTIIFGVLLLKK